MLSSTSGSDETLFGITHQKNTKFVELAIDFGAELVCA